MSSLLSGSSIISCRIYFSVDELIYSFLCKTLQMSINIGGVVSVAVFYSFILGVGIWAGWKQKRKLKKLAESSINQSENIMLAGRDMGLFVGVLTMTGNDESRHDLVCERCRFGFQHAGS